MQVVKPVPRVSYFELIPMEGQIYTRAREIMVSVSSGHHRRRTRYSAPVYRVPSRREWNKPIASLRLAGDIRANSQHSTLTACQHNARLGIQELDCGVEQSAVTDEQSTALMFEGERLTVPVGG
jgi:hypothetical protein